MTVDTLPTPEEDEAFSALSLAQEHQRDRSPEPWVWLPAGEYTRAQLQQLLNSFELMRNAQSGLGGGH